MDKAQVRRILGILMRCMNDQRVGRTTACRSLLAGVPGPVSLQHVDCALSRFLRHRRVAEGIVVVAGVAVRAIVAILLIGAWRRKQQLAESGGG